MEEPRNKKAEVSILIIIAALISIPFVLRWYWFFYMEADEKVQAVLPAPPDCYVPAGVMADGQANATAQAWLDLNGDGIRGADEPPLQDVLVMMTRSGYLYGAEEPPVDWGQLTDGNGQAPLAEFRAGCACHCWEDVAVAAWAPSGYKATTPTKVVLSKADQVVTFGFRHVSP